MEIFVPWWLPIVGFLLLCFIYALNKKNNNSDQGMLVRTKGGSQASSRVEEGGPSLPPNFGFILIVVILVSAVAAWFTLS